MSTHGLLQGHSAVHTSLCITPEGCLDFGTALLDGRGACRVNGDDADQELVKIRKILAPEIVDATELLERSVPNHLVDDLLRGDANIRLVLHYPQHGEERAFGERLYNNDRPRGIHDAGCFSQSPRHGELWDMVKRVEEDRTVEGVVRERHRFRAGSMKRTGRNGP